MKSKTHLLIVSLMAMASPALASSAGTSAAEFLNLGLGPRAIAMGEAQVGLADDAYSTFWNPAGLTTLSSPEAAFVHTSYIEGISEQSLAYAHPTERLGSFGGNFTYLGYGNSQGYDASGLPAGQVGASDVALGLSYAHALYRDERYGSQLSLGVTGKWIHESLDNVSASSFASDWGALFSPGIKWGQALNGLKAGLSLRNIGTPVRFDQESFSLPKTLTAGLSYTANWRGESFTATLDGRQPSSGSRSFGAGIEILTLQALILRGGYTSDSDLGNGFRIGAGLKFKILQVDYAFASAGPFGTAHRFGLTLRFWSQRPNPLLLGQNTFEQGMKEFNNGRYNEALSDFNQTLTLDPAHPQALEMMKKTYEKLKVVAPE